MIKLDKYDMALIMDALQSYACGEIDFNNIYICIRLYDKIGGFVSEADGKEIILCTDDEDEAPERFDSVEPNEVDSQGQWFVRIKGEVIPVSEGFVTALGKIAKDIKEMKEGRDRE